MCLWAFYNSDWGHTAFKIFSSFGFSFGFWPVFRTRFSIDESKGFSFQRLWRREAECDQIARWNLRVDIKHVFTINYIWKVLSPLWFVWRRIVFKIFSFVFDRFFFDVFVFGLFIAWTEDVQFSEFLILKCFCLLFDSVFRFDFRSEGRRRTWLKYSWKRICLLLQSKTERVVWTVNWYLNEKKFKLDNRSNNQKQACSADLMTTSHLERTENDKKQSIQCVNRSISEKRYKIQYYTMNESKFQHIKFFKIWTSPLFFYIYFERFFLHFDLFEGIQFSKFSTLFSSVFFFCFFVFGLFIIWIKGV